MWGTTRVHYSPTTGEKWRLPIVGLYNEKGDGYKCEKLSFFCFLVINILQALPLLPRRRPPYREHSVWTPLWCSLHRCRRAPAMGTGKVKLSASAQDDCHKNVCVCKCKKRVILRQHWKTVITRVMTRILFECFYFCVLCIWLIFYAYSIQICIQDEWYLKIASDRTRTLNNKEWILCKFNKSRRIRTK